MERELLRWLQRPPYMLFLFSAGVGDQCDGVRCNANHQVMIDSSGVICDPLGDG